MGSQSGSKKVNGPEKKNKNIMDQLLSRKCEVDYSSDFDSCLGIQALNSAALKEIHFCVN